MNRREMQFSKAQQWALAALASEPTIIGPGIVGSVDSGAEVSNRRSLQALCRRGLVHVRTLEVEVYSVTKKGQPIAKHLYDDLASRYVLIEGSEE